MRKRYSVTQQEKEEKQQVMDKADKVNYSFFNFASKVFWQCATYGIKSICQSPECILFFFPSQHSQYIGSLFPLIFCFVYPFP